jgi:hypothetical protein
MTRYDPTLLPFWEVNRGGGPVSAWTQARSMAEERSIAREARLADPRQVNDQPGPRPHSPGRNLNYRQRREQGFCTDCGWQAQNGMARCEECRADYNPRHARRVAESRAKARR